MRFCCYLFEWHINNFGIFIYKPFYKPRTCNAVNLRMLAGYPFHRLILIENWLYKAFHLSGFLKPDRSGCCLLLLYKIPVLIELCLYILIISFK